MPKEARPNLDASSPFSESSWMTNADEESARPPPSTKAALALKPIWEAMEMKTSEVRRN